VLYVLPIQYLCRYVGLVVVTSRKIVRFPNNPEHACKLMHALPIADPRIEGGPYEEEVGERSLY
jgi:hypothetical protein